MNEPEIVRLKNAVTEHDHISGPDTAPVTLLEYGNFECIDCGRAYPAIKEARKLLGDNLRFVFRHFPIVRTHPHSLRAAEASEAAAAQGKFWAMHDELFTHQEALEDHDLSHYAKRIGLDVDRFNHDLAEKTFFNEIEAEYQNALFDEHVTGTPTLYISEVRYTGGIDVDSLLAAIKEADTKGLITIPQRAPGLRRLLHKLHRHEKE